MRIAFFGGTFDPPHCGHLAIARAAADRLCLDRVLFAPVGSQPLKQDSSVASFEDRVAMVKLAVADDTRFELSMVDAPRQDDRPNYTIDTLQGIKSFLGPEDHLFCLVGADSFLSLPRWYRAAKLLFACDFIVAGRPGFDFDTAETMLPQRVYISAELHPEPGLSTFTLTNAAAQLSTLYFLPDLHVEISATAVRRALTEHLIRNDVLPEPVAEYIRSRHLYRY